MWVSWNFIHKKYIYIYIYIYIYVFRILCIQYIQYIRTLEVCMSTSGIDMHCIGWGCQSPDLHEIHYFKWEFCVWIAWYFSGMYPWHKTTPSCIFIYKFQCCIVDTFIRPRLCWGQLGILLHIWRSHTDTKKS